MFQLTNVLFSDCGICTSYHYLKSEIWTISHCLGLGLETKVCVLYLAMSLCYPMITIIPTVWMCFRMSVWYRQHLSMSAYMMWLGSALRMSAIILHFIKNIKVLSLAKRWPSPEGSYNIKTILSCIRYPITHIKWPWNILMFIIRVMSLVGCLHIATFNQGPGLLRNFHVKIHGLGVTK